MDPYYKEWLEKEWTKKKKCDLCPQFAETEPDFSEEPIKHINPETGMIRTISYPHKFVEPKLCYFHKKVQEGLFEEITKMTFESWLQRRRHVSKGK